MNGATNTSLAVPSRRRQISYSVPKTQTRLEMYLGAPMEHQLLENVYILIRSYCQYIIEMSGDRPLTPSIDPLSRTGQQGSKLKIKSVDGQRLTFSILEETMQGLLDVLIDGKIYFEAEFEVFHADLGMVGTGNVTGRSEIV